MHCGSGVSARPCSPHIAPQCRLHGSFHPRGLPHDHRGREKTCRIVPVMKALPYKRHVSLLCPKHGIQSFIHKLPSFESAHSFLVFFHPAHSRCLMSTCRVKEWVNLGMRCHSSLIMFVSGMHMPAPKPRLEVKPASILLTQKSINNNNKVTELTLVHHGEWKVMKTWAS